MENDTIVAPATAPGESAIAVVRMSGPRAMAIAAERFRGRSPERSGSHRILFGTFLDDTGLPIDTVLLSVFRAPHSYTGEDSVEVSSHGGSVIPGAILESLVAAGARAARPGEFTERAYKNGKLDLAQAESVAALVRARSDRAARAAEATLGGMLSRRIEELDRDLVPLLAEVEARIDFPNDVDESVDGGSLAEQCARIAAPLRAWLERLPDARRREQGIRVALVGRPNVGKSSLLNALVGYERAIVSDVPGTTRDTVEESIWLDGVEIRLCDAAGVREPSDRLERLGLERAGEAARRADLAILVLDRSDPRDDEDQAALSLIGDRPVLIVWNKLDLAVEQDEVSRGAGGAVALTAKAALRVPRAQLLAEVSTVAIRPGGAEPLRDALSASLRRLSGDVAGDELPATSTRQEGLLRQTVEALERAETALRKEASYDLIAVDLTDARRALGEIVGRGVDQDVVAAIFSQFCIGK
ncbi:MAG TPA: tRNA uridine-5-carboxymethylaminomethyl(34) synthesis GTPase MnmE [Candidatus Limnocylindrales bacterium]|nr:tRNA uridine-5-carboxymethylaminomethyl(34) synthesis GTPase MnmE [Candidatus Limnocylindrales bacterium]